MEAAEAADTAAADIVSTEAADTAAAAADMVSAEAAAAALNSKHPFNASYN